MLSLWCHNLQSLCLVRVPSWFCGNSCQTVASPLQRVPVCVRGMRVWYVCVRERERERRRDGVSVSGELVLDKVVIANFHSCLHTTRTPVYTKHSQQWDQCFLLYRHWKHFLHCPHCAQWMLLYLLEYNLSTSTSQVSKCNILPKYGVGRGQSTVYNADVTLIDDVMTKFDQSPRSSGCKYILMSGGESENW